MKRFPILAAAIVVISGLLLGACGGSGGSTAQPATADGLETAVRAEFDAITASNWSAAYRFLSAECRSSMTAAEFTAQAIMAVAMAKGFGAELSEATLEEVQTRNVADGKGEVLLLVALAGDANDDPSWDDWVYEDGGWRSTDCSTLGDSSSESSVEADEELSYESGFTPYPAAGRSAPDSTSYGIVLTNPNDTEQAESVLVNVTMYDAAGSILKSAETRVSSVAPGAKAYAGGVADDVTGVVRMEVIVTTKQWTKPVIGDGGFKISGVTRRNETYGGTEFNGLITSTYSKLKSADISVLLSDPSGRPVGFTSTSVSDVPANGSKSFSKSTWETIPDDWTASFLAVP